MMPHRKKEVNLRRRLAISLAVLIAVTLVWVPHTLPFFTDKASGQVILAIFLAPLAIVGLVCAYFAGAALVKMGRTKIFAGLIMVGIELACVVGCVVREIILVGYPIKLCFDYCQTVSLGVAILSYLAAVTVLFVPAYLAVMICKQKITPELL